MQINLPAQLPPEILQVKQRLGIVGNAPALIAAITRAIKVAPIDLSVLIIGESGTGKEFFPKIIHQQSSRKHSRYIAVNCGAIPEGTIDSELFGHEKGAFTGAISSRKGYFEEADGGTIFLDEVAELPLTTQARLLRVLETGEFLKVGSSQVQKTNIRVVAATNVNLLQAVEEGRFREDLYYRLSTVQIDIPPLRDRGADINLLARKFATDFAERHRVPQITLSDDAQMALRHYNWPGNVRQLKNVMEQVALFDAGGDVSRSAIEQYLPKGATVYTPALAPGTPHTYEREREMLFNLIFRMQREISDLRAQINAASTDSSSQMQVVSGIDIVPATESAEESSRALMHLRHLDAIDVTPPHAPDTGQHIEPVAPADPIEPESLHDTERAAIINSLRRNGGRRKATAAELNISERTLYRKIKEYGLE